MSAAEIISELPKLTELERCAVRQRLLELAAENEDVEVCNQAALDGALILDRMEEGSGANRTVDLSALGVSEAQAADLRARQKTFFEDWERPEADIYDEDPTR